MASRRDAILEAALGLFAERGYDGVGLREIARFAGVAQPTVNYHFETKEKLLEAVISNGAVRTTRLRAARLNEMLGETAEVTLEDIVRILFEPYNLRDEKSQEELTFNRFIARVGADASVEAKQLIMEAYDDMALEFIRAMVQTPDGFTRDTATKAYLYGSPSGMFAIDHAYRMPVLLGLEEDDPAVQFRYEDVIDFVCAGMRQMCL